MTEDKYAKETMLRDFNYYTKHLRYSVAVSEPTPLIIKLKKEIDDLLAERDELIKKCDDLATLICQAIHPLKSR